MISDFIDPATENWQEMDDAEVWHAAKGGVPQAVKELARRENAMDLTAAPSATVDLARAMAKVTRVNAARPGAVGRAANAVIDDGHTLVHGKGMVATAQRVTERVRAMGHGTRVRRIQLAGKTHLHVARTTR